MSPFVVFVSARRSGVPKYGSTIFNRVDYASDGIPSTKIPRRMALSAPAPTDLMYDVLIQSYKDQGYTIGSGDILNSERVWQDINAPQWGEGPKF